MRRIEELLSLVRKEIEGLRRDGRVRPKDVEQFYRSMDRAESALDECILWVQLGKSLSLLSGNKAIGRNVENGVKD